MLPFISKDASFGSCRIGCIMQCSALLGIRLCWKTEMCLSFLIEWLSMIWTWTQQVHHYSQQWAESQAAAFIFSATIAPHLTHMVYSARVTSDIKKGTRVLQSDSLVDLPFHLFNSVCVGGLHCVCIEEPFFSFSWNSLLFVYAFASTHLLTDRQTRTSSNPIYIAFFFLPMNHLLLFPLCFLFLKPLLPHV